MIILPENTITQLLSTQPSINNAMSRTMIYLGHQLGQLTNEQLKPLAKWMVYTRNTLLLPDHRDYLIWALKNNLDNIKSKLNNPNYKLLDMAQDSKKWHEALANKKRKNAAIGRIVPIQGMPAGWQWVSLDKGYCEKEGEAMGHCGNQGTIKGDNIYSLRDSKNIPHLTFIVNNGKLGESKGFGNDKPTQKYHQMITAFLLGTDHGKPIVEFIAGGGYKPENNFYFTDLTKEEQEKILTLKPHIINVTKYFQYISTNKPEEMKQLAVDMIGVGPMHSIQKEIIIIKQFDHIIDLIEFLKDETQSKLDQIPDFESGEAFLDGYRPDFRSALDNYEQDATEENQELAEKVAENIKYNNMKDYDGEEGIELIKWAAEQENELEDIFQDASESGYAAGAESDAYKSLVRGFNGQTDSNLDAFTTSQDKKTNQWMLTISIQDLSRFYLEWLKDNNNYLLRDAEFKYYSPSDYSGFDEEIYNDDLNNKLKEFLRDYRKAIYKKSLERIPSLFQQQEREEDAEKRHTKQQTEWSEFRKWLNKKH